MLRAFSQLEAVFRAMLVHKASGTDHEEIARLLSLPRPRGFTEADWMNAVHVLAFGARGHPRAVFRFIEMALHRYSVTFRVQLSNLYPTRLLRADPSEPAFDATYPGRFVRIEGALYMVGQEFTSEYVELVPFRTGSFDAPNFTDGKQVYARFLAFRVREATGGPVLHATEEEVQVGKAKGTGVTYEVLLDPARYPSTIPPTYLRGGVAVARTTDPLGGHLTPNASYQARPSGSAWPLYLDNGRRMSEFAAVLDDVLAAGVKVEIKLDASIW